jgi:TonB family protein
MQPTGSSRSRSRSPHNPPSPVPFAGDAGDATPALGAAVDAPPLASRIVLAAPALLIEARFRDVTLASRLLRADARDRFVIGDARGADAPVNPAYLPSAGHALVEAEPAGGFALNLGPAMSAELLTPTQRLSLRPDFGRAEAPLMLPAQSCVRVTCGDVAFDVQAADPVEAMPRPWLASNWQEPARYLAGVALAFIVVLLMARAIPADPRTLSLEDLGLSKRYDAYRIVPVVPPPIDVPPAALPGGGGSPAAKGPEGKAGDKTAPRDPGRRASRGDTPHDAVSVAAAIEKSSLLQVLNGPRSGAVFEVFDDTPALGKDVHNVLGDLHSDIVASTFGAGGLGQVGTGRGGGGTGDKTIGLGGLGTMGKFGRGPGDGPGYGANKGGLLARHKPITPDVVVGVSTVRGSLDKEIIRRIVRRNINQVRYCYQQGLTARPSLEGRAVVQFTIAPTGQVLASVLQSSTLNAVAVESCVVDAVKRWEFPKPDGGGLVIVSYPFQFTRPGE